METFHLLVTFPYKHQQKNDSMREMSESNTHKKKGKENVNLVFHLSCPYSNLFLSMSGLSISLLFFHKAFIFPIIFFSFFLFFLFFSLFPFFLFFSLLFFLYLQYLCALTADQKTELEIKKPQIFKLEAAILGSLCSECREIRTWKNITDSLNGLV